jgi:uncharacterized protein (TIGR02594 family)
MVENRPVKLAPDEYIQRWCPWMETAQRLIGLKEIPGAKHEAMILTMWQKIGASFRDDETPWCAAFTGYCLEDHAFPGSRSAAALSYLKWGRQVVYRDLRDIALGAVVVLNRPGSSWSGHVGFFVKPTIFTGPDEPGVVLLGGNQDNQVKLSSFRLSRVKGVRWPLNPAQVYPPTRSPFVGEWLAAQSRSEA